MIKLAKLSEYTIFKKIKLIIHAFYLFIFLNNHHIKLNAFYILSKSKYPVIINKK